MLTPREKPYLEGLNSYYLHLEKFIEHLQGEMGSGGIHCKSAHREMLIYFSENEIISSLVQDKGDPATHRPSYEIVRAYFYQATFTVKVYQLDAHAIFFWAQLPPFQRAQSVLKSAEIPLPDLVFRLKQKQFSGFIDVRLNNKPENGILFFHEGERVGGSYAWGRGGLSTSHEEYNSLLSQLQASGGTFTFGSFVKEG